MREPRFCSPPRRAAAATAAAAVSVTAELSRDRVAIGGQLLLSVTVEGDQASLPTPKIPPIDAFNVYASGTSQSLNFVNGHMSSSVVYTYVLAPRAVGKFKIPPIAADGAAAPTAAAERRGRRGRRALAPPQAAPAAPAAATAPPQAPAPARSRRALGPRVRRLRRRLARPRRAPTSTSR